MKKLSVVIDLGIFALMIFQLLYVFEGNVLHEILGMATFALVIIHIIVKRKTLAAMFKKKMGGWWLLSKISIVALGIGLALLAFTSIFVSRTIFPFPGFAGSVPLHTWMASISLSIAVFHGCMHGVVRTKKVKRMFALTIVLSIAFLLIGVMGVPFLNRHFKIVEVDANSVNVEEIEGTSGRRVLTVYFTRLGNTDFDEDVDATSGASLMISDGKLKGSDELLAEMVEASIGCEIVPITLTGEKYPSSYTDTVSVASNELKADARPEIEKIDVSDYDDIILIYPLWWGHVPMPVATFLEDNNWEGKDIWLLATQGSSGFGSTIKDVEEMAIGANVHKGISIYCDDIPNSADTVTEWLKTIFE